MPATLSMTCSVFVWTLLASTHPYIRTTEISAVCPMICDALVNGGRYYPPISSPTGSAAQGLFLGVVIVCCTTMCQHTPPIAKGPISHHSAPSLGGYTSYSLVACLNGRCLSNLVTSKTSSARRSDRVFDRGDGPSDCQTCRPIVSQLSNFGARKKGFVAGGMDGRPVTPIDGAMITPVGF
jgi:hypothetical protein